MTLSSPIILRLISSSTGAGDLPYLPYRYSLISFGTILYLSPDSTLRTACVPTICDNGVTSGG